MGVDPEKLNRLAESWQAHEAWMQTASEADAEGYRSEVPGYNTLIRQGYAAWEVYRDWLMLLLAEFRGGSPILADLNRLTRNLATEHSKALNRLRQQHERPDPAFLAQWTNIFHEMKWDGLSHSSLQAYVRKYEVEWPLVLLANLREILSTGGYDVSLARFRDRRGALKKGMLVDFVGAGFGDYPALKAGFTAGYVPRLRNAVGHNAYQIKDGLFRSLEGDLSLSEESFRNCFLALETVQNGLIWISKAIWMHEHAPPGSGVLSVGWALEDDREEDLLFFQSVPHWALNPDADWLSEVVVTVDNGEVVTAYGGPRTTTGPLNARLEAVLKAASQAGAIRCTIMAVSPCVHIEEHGFNTPDGTFCEAGWVCSKTVPLRIESSWGEAVVT